MEAAQVCDRLRGEETCPFHKGQKITSLCITCGILVCMKCVMSSEHAGHTFKEIASSLREPTDNLAKHITEIEKKLLIAVDKELSEMKNKRAESIQKHSKGVKEINEQRQKTHLQIDKVQRAHLKIDTNADSKVAKWDEHSQQVLGVLDKHTERLESLRKQLNEERKECTEILQKGSNVLKFDAGLEIKKKTQMQRIPKAPTVSELEYIKCVHNFDDLLLQAMGVLKEVDLTHDGAEMINKPKALELVDKPQASSCETVKQHQYQSIETISKTDNDHIYGFSAITPIEKDAACACYNTGIYGFGTRYDENNKLYLINSKRECVQKVGLDANIYWLQIHPITKQVLSISDKGHNIRSINTSTGKTKTIVKCPVNIHRLKVTHDNHVIFGTRFSKEAIYKYKLSGEMRNESKEKYKVHDIDSCPQTNRVAISTKKEGLTLLNSDLTMMKTYNRKNMYCRSAIFDSHGNLVVADHSNKEIIVLGGEHLSYIQKLEIDGITRPDKLRIYDNILWVTCDDKLICVRIT